MPTPKQERLIQLLIENYGNPTPRSLGELIVSAGYSPESAKNPSLIIKSDAVQEGLDEVVKELEKNRNEALGLLPKQAKKAKYRDLVEGVDKLTKNIQLLSGKETEKSKVESTINVINYGDNAAPQV